MITEMGTLHDAVLSVAENSRVADQVQGVTLEAANDDDGYSFLRILVRLKSLDKAADADIEELANAIEGAVSALDERFPSVRFTDAA